MLLQPILLPLLLLLLLLNYTHPERTSPLKRKRGVYTVQWKGFPESENSEIPYENFDSKKAISLYYRRINKKNPHVKRFINKKGRITKTVQAKKSKLPASMETRSANFNIFK